MLGHLYVFSAYGSRCVVLKTPGTVPVANGLSCPLGPSLKMGTLNAPGVIIFTLQYSIVVCVIFELLLLELGRTLCSCHTITLLQYFIMS